MRAIDADALEKVKFHPLPYTHITPNDVDAESYKRGWNDAIDAIVSETPTIEPEPLTDKEQRIFLAAMGREEKVCMEVDRNYIREPYEDSLMRVCKEIRRKVKGALWT